MSFASWASIVWGGPTAGRPAQECEGKTHGFAASLAAPRHEDRRAETKTISGPSALEPEPLGEKTNELNESSAQYQLSLIAADWKPLHGPHTCLSTFAVIVPAAVFGAPSCKPNFCKRTP